MMDALSEVLQSIRLTGGLFLEAHLTAPWCIASRLAPEDCRPYLSHPVQVIPFHYATRGRWWLEMAGEPPIEVRPGEAVLLPRNDPHVMGSAAGLRPVSAASLVQHDEGGRLRRITHGGGGEAAHIVCGFLGSDQHRSALLATLPPVLKIDMAEAGADEWIESCLRFALQGMGEGRVGAQTVMSRLAELMLVEAVRRYAATLPAGWRGWLAGLRDPNVGRALALLHARPNHPWTTESLAAAVALSRSAFSDRFTATVGMPPKRYLIACRLQLAQDKLREGCQSIAEIAHEIGYDAEVAFNRAFRREFGMPPGAWRKQIQSGHA
jgi:AraC-like DNA-binding protein